MASAAERILGCPVRLELSVQNVDKEALSRRGVDQRLRNMVRGHNVVLTRAPLFLEKARRFNDCCLVLGFDTAARLLDVSYYGGEARLKDALAEMRALRCRFLVAGRERDGVYHAWDNRLVPEGFADLFEPIPEAVFREDIHAEGIRSARLSYKERV